MFTLENLKLALETLGALSALLGTISHLPLGKFSAVCGELGLDVAGFVKVLRTPTEKP